MILIFVFLLGFKLTSKITGNLYTTLWITIPLAIIISILGFFIMRPIKEDLRKNSKTKRKTEVSIYEAIIDIFSFASYFFGVIYVLFGLFFLVLAFIYYLKNFNSLEILFIIGFKSYFFIISGIGILLLITGVLAIFAGRGLSKRKKWGRNILTILLIFHTLFFLLPIFFGELGGIVFGLACILAFSGLVYELNSKKYSFH